MRKNKSGSTLLAFSIMVFGVIFELWTSSLFSLGGKYISMLFFIPIITAIICLYLAFRYYKAYKSNQKVSTLTLTGLIFLACAGFLINIAINIYGISQFKINH